jgi:hypothetical protein
MPSSTINISSPTIVASATVTTTADQPYVIATGAITAFNQAIANDNFATCEIVEGSTVYMFMRNALRAGAQENVVTIAVPVRTPALSPGSHTLSLRCDGPNGTGAESASLFAFASG